MLVVFLLRSKILPGPQQLQLLSAIKLMPSFMVVLLAVCLCFLADRTHLFDKVHKEAFSNDFWMLIGFVLVLGTITIRRSKAHAMVDSKDLGLLSAQEEPLLSRYQTDEWKGWMQFVILIYHYTGASKVLWIYEVIRLLVASYLFMTGFGHTVYFLKKKDYSFRRVAGVLVRLNLLSCVLPYMMRTDYLFYYFAPLVSFWFLVLFFTLRTAQDLNDNTSFLMSKMAISAAITTAITKVPGVLEAIFSVLKYTCHIRWNVQEWRFRVFLDMFILYVGMFCAVVFIKLTSKSPVQNQEYLFSYLRERFPAFRIALITISILILPTFWALAYRFPTKFKYNSWQPYISPFPILAYVVLRNSHRHLRNYHSSAFAWLGRCSLETFTLQYHIWLAADTKGLLSTGIFDGSGKGRWVEFVVLTVFFLWISHCVAGATNVLTKWILDGGEIGEDRDRPAPMLELHQVKAEDRTGQPANSDDGFIRAALLVPAMIWTKDLRLRLGLILLLMWVLNMMG